ncbi:E3 ubiquitin-protein ligase MGRN1-like isoform X2 [Tetranychus urticae]|uniref:E3 ubiquitin-protein ligase MGRN1-like isoform X2 n=1 Tax=Tetranychus urticae TaxID=32264 RepID=UPI000D657B87|nr:E3 ubiquitin-protein ligase MGRN1-like isoform X2 [Tetranychus urticae]
MGNLLDRSRDDAIEEESVDQLSNHYGHHGYTFPPRSGCYFAGHFIMGGAKFETGQPEAYLFGDNMDLNFLGPKPLPFPYLAPLPDELTRSLRALINIRKETLRLIKIPSTESDLANQSSSISKSTSGKLTNQLANDNEYINKLPNHYELKELPSSSSSTVAVPTTLSSSSLNSSTPAQTQTNLLHETNQLLVSSSSSSSSSSNGPLYTIEFTFDSDVKCSITIYYLSVEETTPSGITYIPRDPGYKTETFHYPKGASQIFSQPSLIFNPSAFNEDDLLYRAIDEYGNFDPTVPFPIVIQLTAEEGSEPRQSHSLIATVERNNEKLFNIKPFKQKIIIDGLAYLIQEVYGIENKNTVRSSFGKPHYSSDEEIEDNGSECVICMSESRDTLILPCRHLCLCNACADSLRYQANNCPICRSPFRALLQFRAVRKILNNGQAVTTKSSSNMIKPVEPLNTSSSSKRSLSSSSESRNSHPTSSTRPTTAVDSTDAKSDTPPGYEAISLIEALNGPPSMPSSSSRPGDYGLYGYQGSFDDENVAPLASIEATTKSISGSSQSMVVIKDRDTLRHLKESISNSKNSRHAKSSSSSLSEIRYPIPSSSSSSPRMGSRSKSISKSKLAMVNSVIERGGKNYRSSESLTLWSQQDSPESGSEDQEKVKLLDQENSHQSHPRQKQTTSSETRSVYIEPIRSRKALRKRGSLYDDSELKALNSSSHNSSNNQLEMDSIEALDINSINLSATSYPDLFLRDGFDEQRFMDETDMLSVSTNDSVPNEFTSK